MSVRTGSAIGAALALVVLVGAGACGPSAAGTRVIIDPGLEPVTSAEGIARTILFEIEQNQKRLGRILAPARIVSMRYARGGTSQPILRRDGSNPDGSFLTLDGVGWIVEAEGTFLSDDRRTGVIAVHATRAYLLLEDSGIRGTVYLPCWSSRPLPAENLDGACP